MDILGSAYTIALINLRHHYCDEGIIAGSSHYSDLWSRDACFAGWGALCLRDIKIVKTTIKSLLHFMKEDGQIPLRIGEKYILMKHLGNVHYWEPCQTLPGSNYRCP